MRGFKNMGEEWNQEHMQEDRLDFLRRDVRASYEVGEKMGRIATVINTFLAYGMRRQETDGIRAS